jgi:hypothetical protein
MKSSLLIILLAVISFQLSGQRKLSASFEISTGVSEVRNPEFQLFTGEIRGLQLGGSLFLRSGYILRKNLELTLGIGYLFTREFSRLNLRIIDDVDYFETRINHRYIVVPVGFQYHFGSFYINPEIGLGIKNGSGGYQNSSQYNGNYTIIISGSVKTPDYVYHKISLPLMLNFGNEFDLKSVKILLGVKGFYSLNNQSDLPVYSGHYYGVGIVTGVRF